MTESAGYKFDMPKQQPSIIKVIGVGGGGSNAVNHMFAGGIKDVEFVVANTDLQALNSSPVPCKVQLGVVLTQGLGCGSDPSRGQASAEESKEEIRQALSGSKMVFITAGMGGGTGTGAAPVIAKIAKDMDILTIGIVTVPFSFEGKKKIAQAMVGIEAMRTACDTVLMVLNDKIREIFGSVTASRAFSEADNVLTTAAKGIAEIITCPGHINVDFQDVHTAMFNAGGAVMGSAEVRGENRALLAAQQALSSPLLNNHDIMGAKKILLSITSGEKQEVTMDELGIITEYIQEQAGENAEMKYGHSVDADLGDRVKVTVIVTGFESTEKEIEQPAVVKKVGEVGKSDGELPALDITALATPQEGIELKPKPAPAQQKIKFDDFSLEMPSEKQEQKELPDYAFSIGPRREPEPIDEFDLGKGEGVEEYITGDGLMGWRKTKARLEEERRERSERIKSGKPHEMSKEDFDQKNTEPAYIRRRMQLEETPHAYEKHISRYNLNDDNTIVKNNKFFHDNVD